MFEKYKVSKSIKIDIFDRCLILNLHLCSNDWNKSFASEVISDCSSFNS